MATFEIFIGADNDTHAVDRDTLYATLDARHQGWTAHDALGAWLGHREDTVRVIVADDAAAVLATVTALRDILRQEAVAYREISAMVFV